jgi:hypothetical protein
MHTILPEIVNERNKERNMNHGQWLIDGQYSQCFYSRITLFREIMHLFGNLNWMANSRTGQTECCVTHVIFLFSFLWMFWCSQIKMELEGFLRVRSHACDFVGWRKVPWIVPHWPWRYSFVCESTLYHKYNSDNVSRYGAGRVWSMSSQALTVKYDIASDRWDRQGENATGAT